MYAAPSRGGIALREPKGAHRTSGLEELSGRYAGSERRYWSALSARMSVRVPALIAVSCPAFNAAYTNVLPRPEIRANSSMRYARGGPRGWKPMFVNCGSRGAAELLGGRARDRRDSLGPKAFSWVTSFANATVCASVRSKMELQKFACNDCKFPDIIFRKLLLRIFRGPSPLEWKLNQILKCILDPLPPSYAPGLGRFPDSVLSWFLSCCALCIYVVAHEILHLFLAELLCLRFR